MNEDEKKKKEELLVKVPSELFNGFDEATKSDAESMLGTIRKATNGDSNAATVRTKLYEGMEFTATGVCCTSYTPPATADNANPTTIYTLYVTTSKGARVRADYFGTVVSDVTIGFTDEEVCKFVAYHKKAQTPFVLSTFVPRRGRYGDDNYRAESGEVTIKGKK